MFASTTGTFGRHFVLLCAVLLVMLAISGERALADTPPDNAQLYEIIKGLQSRVSALEARLNEAEQASARDRSTTIAATKVAYTSPRSDAKDGSPREEERDTPTTTPTPVRVAALEPTSATAPVTYASEDKGPRADQWNGIYWGASFGGGLIQSNIRRSQTSSDSGGSSSTFDGENSGTGYGAAVDLFAGENFQIAPKLVVGVQLEGSLANVDASANLTFTGVSSPTSTSSNTLPESTEAKWLVTALGRAGFLLDPTTMAYAVAGWTVAGFRDEDFGMTFTANGPSVGGGLEKKIDANWSIRADYMFTHFLPTELEIPNTSSFSSAASSFTTTSVTRIEYENDLHLGRIGISYLIPAGPQSS